MLPMLAGMFGSMAGQSGGQAANTPQGGDAISIDTPIHFDSPMTGLGGSGNFWIFAFVGVLVLALLLRRGR